MLVCVQVSLEERFLKIIYSYLYCPEPVLSFENSVGVNPSTTPEDSHSYYELLLIHTVIINYCLDRFKK